jgi:hypothetical protein
LIDLIDYNDYHYRHFKPIFQTDLFKPKNMASGSPNLYLRYAGIFVCVPSIVLKLFKKLITMSKSKNSWRIVPEGKLLLSL